MATASQQTGSADSQVGQQGPAVNNTLAQEGNDSSEQQPLTNSQNQNKTTNGDKTGLDGSGKKETEESDTDATDTDALEEEDFDIDKEDDDTDEEETESGTPKMNSL